MPTLPAFEVRRHDDVTIVRFAELDRLDEYNSREACKELVGLAEHTPGSRFLLDIGDIGFVSSAGLGKLVALSRKVRATGGRLRLANLSPAIAEALALTRLDRILEVCPRESVPAPAGSR